MEPRKKIKKKPLKNHYLGGNIENCCGYCKLHRRPMTVKQMKARQCLDKECRHFLKIIAHLYWNRKKGEVCRGMNVCAEHLPVSVDNESKTTEN